MPFVGATAFVLDVIDDYGGGYRNLEQRREEGANFQPWVLSQGLELFQLGLFLALALAFLVTPLPPATGKRAAAFATAQGLGWAGVAAYVFFIFDDVQEYSPSNRPYRAVMYALILAAGLATSLLSASARIWPTPVVALPPTPPAAPTFEFGPMIKPPPGRA